MKTTLMIIALLLLAGSALAVPVDPNAADGIAAIYAEDALFMVLKTNGDIFIASDGGWDLSIQQLPPGVTVGDIWEWYGLYHLVTNDKVLWRNLGGRTENWVEVGTLPQDPVAAGSESLGSVKALFR